MSCSYLLWGPSMKLFHCKSSAVVTTMLGLILLSGAATAAMNYDWDRKSYSGAQCQPAYGNQSADFTIFQGRLRNDAGGNRWVSCAITFDAEDTLDSADSSLATPAGGFNLYVFLDYSGVPAGPSFTTNCTLAGRDPSGVNLTQALSVASTKTTTQQSIYFTGVPLDGLAIGDQATIQISCLLPSKIALTTVKVYELGRTDETYYTP